MSQNRKTTNPDPGRRGDHDRARARHRQGPQGRAVGAGRARHHRRSAATARRRRRRAADRHAPDRSQRAPCAARPDPYARRQHGDRRHRSASRSAWSSRASATAPQLKGTDLELALGYSHPVPVKAPDGIEFEVPQPTRIIVRGASKQQVGEIAAYIRKQRKPEPYKGKGIRYEGEYVAKKVGKRA